MGSLGDGDSPVFVDSGTLGSTVKDGAEHTVRLVYTNENPTRLAAFMDGVLIANATLSEQADEILNSRFSYFGFTGSTSWLQTADIHITSLNMLQQPPETELAQGFGFKVTNGQPLTYLLQYIDTCQQVVTPPATANITAKLDFEDETNGQDIVLEPELVQRTSQGFEITFFIPQRVEGAWTVDVVVDGIQARGTPAVSGLFTENEQPPLLPTWGLGVLIGLIAMVALVLIYSVNRLYRYRKKLKENEDDINAGKEKRYLDELDREVDYTMNPMLGTLEDMKKKLQENEAELARLRQGLAGTFDESETVESLQEKNRMLREEMKKLKMELQQEEAMNANYRAELGDAAPTKRREFDQTRA